MTIKQLPESERPYEKLILYGEKNLTNAELLAIILKTGTKEYTSIDLARNILRLNDDYDKENLNFLRNLSIEDIMQIKGIGKVKAIQIRAICEIANRLNVPVNYRKIQIKEPNDIVNILMNDMQYENVEIAKTVLLDNKNFILKIKNVATGGNNFVSIGIKEVFSEAVKINAPKLILVHNHPSGLSNPSKQDIEITEKIENAANILGIKFLDHIIIGKSEYTSIKTIEKWKFKFRKE